MLIVTTSVLLMVFSVWLFGRSEAVYLFRMRLVDRVYAVVVLKAIKHRLGQPSTTGNFNRLVEEIEKVSYNKMVFSFWKDLRAKNFYKDLSFLEDEDKILSKKEHL